MKPAILSLLIIFFNILLSFGQDTISIYGELDGLIILKFRKPAGIRKIHDEKFPLEKYKFHIADNSMTYDADGIIRNLRRFYFTKNNDTMVIEIENLIGSIFLKDLKFQKGEYKVVTTNVGQEKTGKEVSKEINASKLVLIGIATKYINVGMYKHHKYENKAGVKIEEYNFLSLVENRSFILKEIEKKHQVTTPKKH